MSFILYPLLPSGFGFSKLGKQNWKLDANILSLLSSKRVCLSSWELPCGTQFGGISVLTCDFSSLNTVYNQYQTFKETLLKLEEE